MADGGFLIADIESPQFPVGAILLIALDQLSPQQGDHEDRPYGNDPVHLQERSGPREGDEAIS